MGVTGGDRKRWCMLIRVTEWEKGVTSTYCRASQKAVTAYFTSKQLLPFVYAWRHGSVIYWRNPLVNPLIIPTVTTLNQSDNVNSHRESISGGPSSATQQTVILSSSLDNTWPTRVDPRGKTLPGKTLPTRVAVILTSRVCQVLSGEDDPYLFPCSPRKHGTVYQYCFNAGPPSLVCWDVGLYWLVHLNKETYVYGCLICKLPNKNSKIDNFRILTFITKIRNIILFSVLIVLLWRALIIFCSAFF